MKRCAAHNCWAPASALAVDYCAAHQQLIRAMQLWLADGFDADRLELERLRPGSG